MKGDVLASGGRSMTVNYSGLVKTDRDWEKMFEPVTAEAHNARLTGKVNLPAHPRVTRRRPIERMKVVSGE